MIRRFIFPLLIGYTSILLFCCGLDVYSLKVPMWHYSCAPEVSICTSFTPAALLEHIPYIASLDSVISFVYGHIAILAIFIVNLWTTTTILSAIIVCCKCILAFLVIVLIRVTTPKFKMETLTKLGWLYSLCFLLYLFGFYWLGFFLI